MFDPSESLLSWFPHFKSLLRLVDTGQGEYGLVVS